MGMEAETTAVMDTDETPTTPASDPPTPGRLDAAVEALLLSLDRPTPSAKLAEAVGGAGLAEVTAEGVDASVERLNASYAETGRAFRIEHVAGGLRLMTLPEFAPILAAFHRLRAPSRLTRAALETLAIVAYRQPVTRAELEAIRGVACGEVLRSLLDRKLIRIAGRAEELGRPMLYGTTKQFLDTFGLASLQDLPESGELPGTRARTTTGGAS